MVGRGKGFVGGVVVSWRDILPGSAERRYEIRTLESYAAEVIRCFAN